MRRPIHFLLAASLAALAISPAATAQCAEARKPGSVLIYAGHNSAPQSFTIISVTNSNQSPQTPTAFGGSVRVHFEYVNTVFNAQNPFCPHDCVVFDRHEFLTPADTMSVLTACHNATSPGVDTGYVVLSAQDPSGFDIDICHDYLLGSMMTFNASGMFYSLNAIPVQCAAGPDGTPTDINGNGQLDFDGVEYLCLADQVMIESFIAVPRTRLCLINLTGTCQDINQLYFSIYNDNEFPLSATLDFKIWFDRPLNEVSPAFEGSFLANVPNDPEELDVFCNGNGLLETGWVSIQSVGVVTAGGQQIAPDGVVVGCITSGIGGDALLWSTTVPQNNGTFIGR
ncbi:MAG: hypothetical protein KDB80_03410 [Planctomycetes bacterium]|nr:hypothetical protein [Planctomycetota bacterium]